MDGASDGGEGSLRVCRAVRLGRGVYVSLGAARKELGPWQITMVVVSVSWKWVRILKSSAVVRRVVHLNHCAVTFIRVCVRMCVCARECAV